MKRQIQKTKDDSSTLFVPELDEHYHSVHGALQESIHVFINAGLAEFYSSTETISILEIGFGTGLNALLSLLKAEEQKLSINYVGLEKYPVTEEEYPALNYSEKLEHPAAAEYLKLLHQAPWEKPQNIKSYFQLVKHQIDFRQYSARAIFDLVYFDAFAPSAQPDLWTIDMFTSMFDALKPCGILVTYCVKGEVRRNMKTAGFKVEKLPGPPGKREMARAWKES